MFNYNRIELFRNSIIYCMVADSKFTVIYPHSIESLQKIMECIMIKRFTKKIINCLKFTINNMEYKRKEGTKMFIFFKWYR